MASIVAPGAKPQRYPRQILMTTDTVGGVWTYSIELCRALSNKGIRVALAAMGGAVDRSRARELRDLQNVELFESEYRLEWMDDPWADVDAAGEWLLSIAAEVQPDLVHLNGYAHAALDWRIPSVVVAHSCVLSWWQAVKGEPAPRKYDEYWRRVTVGLRSTDLVVAPTGAMLNEIARCYGLAAPGIVIPNGRSAAGFLPGRKREMVFSSGRLWDEGKNVQALVGLAGKIEWPICLAGETAGPASQLGNRRGVNLLGRLSAEQIAAWYSRAAIYAHPAKYEPFGLAVLEAALAGCALVLSDIPSLRENWEGAAVFMPPGDSAQWEAAIRDLIQDAVRLKRLQERAASRARRFSVAAMADKYLDAYALASANFANNARESDLRRAG